MKEYKSARLAKTEHSALVLIAKDLKLTLTEAFGEAVIALYEKRERGEIKAKVDPMTATVERAQEQQP